MGASLVYSETNIHIPGSYSAAQSPKPTRDPGPLCLFVLVHWPLTEIKALALATAAPAGFVWLSPACFPTMLGQWHRPGHGGAGVVAPGRARRCRGGGSPTRSSPEHAPDPAAGVCAHRVLLPGVPRSAQCRRPQHNAGHICLLPLLLPLQMFSMGQFVPPGKARVLVRQPRPPALQARSRGAAVPFTAARAPGSCSKDVPARHLFPQALLDPSDCKRSPAVFSVQGEAGTRGRLLSQRDMCRFLSVPVPEPGAADAKGLNTAPGALQSCS